MITEEEIESSRSSKGGFTKETLAKWGVAWPPKKGWRQALLDGHDPNNPPEADHVGALERSPIRPAVSAHELLRQVVLSVVERGHASDLYQYPDVLAYFGAQMPDRDQ